MTTLKLKELVQMKAYENGLSGGLRRLSALCYLEHIWVLCQ